MNKKHMVFGLLLFAVLVLSIPGSATADGDQYEATNVTIQLGSDEKELNFTWFTKDRSETCEFVICREDKLKDGMFPKNADVYAGTVEVVEVEEQSGGGPGGPPPGMTATATEEAVVAEEDEATVYACKVTGVKVNPNKEYAYALSNGDDLSKIYYFKTQNPSSFNFIFVGDPQIGASRNETNDTEGWKDAVTAALAKFENTNFILSAGDQVESSTSSSQYDGFFSPAEFTSVPFAPAIGNHDTSDLYAYHFSVPNESDLGCTDGGCDYWFTYKDTLFMVLNTNNSSAASHGDFMEQAIAANPDALWKVVVFHQSLYSSASHVTDVNNLRTAMAPVIGTYDIDVVLSGHDHFYARTYQLTGGVESEVNGVKLTDEVVPAEMLTYNKNGAVVDPIGTVYFTANSASGSKFYNFKEIDGYTNIYLAAYDASKTASYLNVEVKGSNLTVSAWSVEKFNEDGEIDPNGEPKLIDTYSIHKDVD